METISLGKHEEIPVYPQKWAYLLNRTSKTVNKIIDSTGTLDLEVSLGGTIGGWVGTSSYELLVALIPVIGKRMPEYEFAGYSSKEAYEQGNYVEEEDNSPTIPEIVEAFTVAIRVNRFDLISILKNIIDPKKLRGPITERLAEAISRGSQSSQQQNGQSPLTPSSTNPQTSQENGDTPSQESNPSSSTTLLEEQESSEN